MDYIAENMGYIPFLNGTACIRSDCIFPCTLTDTLGPSVTMGPDVTMETSSQAPDPGIDVGPSQGDINNDLDMTPAPPKRTPTTTTTITTTTKPAESNSSKSPGIDMNLHHYMKFQKVQSSVAEWLRRWSKLGVTPPLSYWEVVG